MYSPEFAADPHGAYGEMRRRHGSLVPIELSQGVSATLVIGYQEAVRILNDPEHFPADPRIWQKSLTSDSPIRPMMEWHPNAQRNSGAAHARYRGAYSTSIEGIDLHELHSMVERFAVPLINTFCRAGTANLVTQYAFPLVCAVFNEIVGCPSALGHRVTAGMAMLVEAVDPVGGMRMLSSALTELIRLRRAAPGDDVASRLAHHWSNLTDDEMLSQLVGLYGAAIEPQQNLMTSAVLLMLTDGRSTDDVLDGGLSSRDALDEVLFSDPPVANMCITYPRQPIVVADTWLPAHQPVLISLAACNNDPAVRSGDRTGNRAHLAWAVGPHACPAKTVASVVVREAIDQLFDALPDMRLAVPRSHLFWRPGPFHRALAALPVVFPKSPPLMM